MSVTMNDPKMTASCVALLAFLKELKVETSKALNKDEPKLLEKIDIAMQMAIIMDDRWNNTLTTDEWLDYYKKRNVELENMFQKLVVERDEANRRVQQLVVERDEANRRVQQLVVEIKKYNETVEQCMSEFLEQELRPYLYKCPQLKENELLDIRLSELQNDYHSFMVLNKERFSHSI